MSDPRPSAELIPFGEVQRLVQERRRRPRPAGPSDLGGGGAPRHRDTAEVQRLLARHRTGSPSGPEAA